MNYVKCETREGLRSTEVSVCVSEAANGKQFLRVERTMLLEESGNHYLPVGVLTHNGKSALIELPHEADSGANRLWVDMGHLRDSL